MKKLRDYLSIEDKRFEAVWNENGFNQVNFGWGDDWDVDADTPEWKCAIVEIVDELNTLRVGETIYFQGDRDDKNTKGYVVRTK